KHSPHKKIIGVCNIPYNMRHSSAEILDADPNDILIEFIGLNHFVFGRNVYVKGENRTQEVLNNLANNELDYSPANIIRLGWSKTYIESVKLLPNPYHEYYFQTRSVLAKDIQEDEEHGTRVEVERELETSLFQIYYNAKL